MRPHGRFRVNPKNPAALAVCDRCGFVYNHDDLQWQYEWFGARTQNTNLLVCDDCLDVLQEQLRTIVLPADPQPIDDPRPERDNLNNNPESSIGDRVGTLTQGAGLAAAFDSNTNKPRAQCAQIFTSAATLSNSVGRNWTLWGQMLISRFKVWAPNDAPFLGSGAPTAYAFQGSQVNAGYTTLYSGTTAGTNGEIIDVTITPTIGYYYYQIVFTGDGTTPVAVAQLQMYQAG